MSSSYGQNIRLTIFGQSHSPAIGMTLEGIPAGETIDFEKLQAFLGRRAPGKPAIGMTLEGIPAGETIDFEKLQAFLGRRAPGRNVWSTARKEADVPEFLSGLVKNTTCGTPLTAMIRNTDTRSKDYSDLAIRPRPGHADYTAAVKYRGHQDYAGGGHFSGRLTAALCIAGGICRSSRHDYRLAEYLHSCICCNAQRWRGCRYHKDKAYNICSHYKEWFPLQQFSWLSRRGIPHHP